MQGPSRREFIIGAGCTAATIGVSVSGSEAVTSPSSAAQALIDAERKRITDVMASDDIPGVAACLIHGGAPVWTEGFGVTDRKSTRRVSADTLFSIQSTSKHLTATAIMLAVQRGLLDLDRPITEYLPDFTVHSRFESAPQRKMTLRLLLSHRAGFTHEAPVGNNYDPESPSFEAHVRSISQTWLRFPVGERYRYSNLGFDLAGYILQVRSGRPFAECMKLMLFDPLGMKSSTAATDVYVAKKDRALGHQRGYASVPLKTPLIASGGVYTTARDISAYCMFHLDRGKVNGRTVLDEKLWDEMHGFAFGGDYSLGVIRKEWRHGTTALRLLTHQGGGFGFGSVFEYCPQAGLAWVAMFNRGTSAAYRFGDALIRDALTQRFGAKKPRMPVEDLAPVEIPATWLRKYAGNYVGRNITADLTVQNGALAMQVKNKVAPIRFLSNREMFAADEDGSAVMYKYSAATPAEPAHLECWVGEISLDFNEAPDDAAGPDEPEWSRYLGTYQIVQWGRVTDTVTVQRRNGYLYLDRFRLIQGPEAGLFFTADGEAVDFRSSPPTWRNVRLPARQNV